MTYTDAFATEQVKVSLLAPELVKDLERAAVRISELDYELGNEQWNIAGRVNEMWDEHKGIFDNRLAYFAEASRIANLVNRRKLFAESGETLRRWCEVRATYDNFEHAELFLDALSFDHLYRARKLYLSGKVKTPILALALADTNKWSAEDMEYHYDNDRPAAKTGFINWLKTFVDKRLPKLELPKEKTEEVNKLVARIVELLQ